MQLLFHDLLKAPPHPRAVTWVNSQKRNAIIIFSVPPSDPPVLTGVTLVLLALKVAPDLHSEGQDQPNVLDKPSEESYTDGA